MLLVVLYSLTIFTSSSTRESNEEVGSYVRRKGEEKMRKTLKYSKDHNISYLEALERMDGKESSNVVKMRIVELIEEYESLFQEFFLYKSYLERYETDTTGEMEGSTFEFDINKIKDDIEELGNSMDKIAENIGSLSIEITLMRILIFISKFFVLYRVF